MNISTSNEDLTLLTTESFTLCFRFYLRILGTITFQKRGNVIHIPGILQLWAAYPNRSEIMMIRNIISKTLKNFSSCPSIFFFGPSSYILKHPDLGFRPFAPNMWNHMCVSFNTATDMIRLILVVIASLEHASLITYPRTFSEWQVP